MRSSEELRKENDALRALVAATAVACVYCQKFNMVECPYGFPGCPQYDDLMTGVFEVESRVSETIHDLKSELKEERLARRNMAMMLLRLSNNKDKYSGEEIKAALRRWAVSKLNFRESK